MSGDFLWGSAGIGCLPLRRLGVGVLHRIGRRRLGGLDLLIRLQYFVEGILIIGQPLRLLGRDVVAEKLGHASRASHPPAMLLLVGQLLLGQKSLVRHANVILSRDTLSVVHQVVLLLRGAERRGHQGGALVDRMRGLIAVVKLGVERGEIGRALGGLRLRRPCCSGCGTLVPRPRRCREARLGSD